MVKMSEECGDVGDNEIPRSASKLVARLGMYTVWTSQLSKASNFTPLLVIPVVRLSRARGLGLNVRRPDLLAGSGAPKTIKFVKK
jgi:hypothetical protein